jgi:hypothetical protein
MRFMTAPRFVRKVQKWSSGTTTGAARLGSTKCGTVPSMRRDFGARLRDNKWTQCRWIKPTSDRVDFHQYVSAADHLSVAHVEHPVAGQVAGQ